MDIFSPFRQKDTQVIDETGAKELPKAQPIDYPLSHGLLEQNEGLEQTLEQTIVQPDQTPNPQVEHQISVSDQLLSPNFDQPMTEEQFQAAWEQMEPYPGYPSKEHNVKWDDEKIKAWEEAGFPEAWLPAAAPTWDKDKIQTWAAHKYPAWWCNPVCYGWSLEQLQHSTEAEVQALAAQTTADQYQYHYYPHSNYLKGLALKYANPAKFGLVREFDGSNVSKKPSEVSFGGHLQRTDTGRVLHSQWRWLLKYGVPAAQNWSGFYWGDTEREKGAEKAGDPVVLCLFSNPDGTQSLKALFIERIDVDKPALPGGMIDPNEPAATASLRELFEESGVTLTNVAMEIIGTEVVMDPRVLLTSWPESTASLIVVDQAQAEAMKFKPQPGETRKVAWTDVSEENLQKLFSPTHVLFVKRAVARWQERTGLVADRNGRVGKAESVEPVAETAPISELSPTVDFQSIFDQAAQQLKDELETAVLARRKLAEQRAQSRYPRGATEQQILAQASKIGSRLPIPGMRDLYDISQDLKVVNDQAWRPLINDLQTDLNKFRQTGHGSIAELKNMVERLAQVLKPTPQLQQHFISEGERMMSHEASVGVALNRLREVVTTSVSHGLGEQLAFETSHQTWAKTTEFFSQRKDTSTIDATAVANKSEDEMNKLDKNRGNNVANVFLAADFLQRAILDSSNPVTVGQLQAWVQSEAPLEQKLTLFPDVHDVVIALAQFMHNTWAFSRHEYDNVWSSSHSAIEVNRRKSFVVATALINDLAMYAVTGKLAQPHVIEDPLVIKELVRLKLDIEPDGGEVLTLWDELKQMKFSYEPMDSPVNATLLERLKVALMSDNPDLNGGRAKGMTEAEAEAALQPYQAAQELNVYEFAAALVHQGWTKEQLKNAKRVTVALTGNPQIDKRRGVKVEGVDKQGDPLIVPYTALSEAGKNNNIIATAGVSQEVRRMILEGAITSAQELYQMLESVVLHNFKPNGTLDGSHALTEELSAAQHGVWAMNALYRDGLKAFSTEPGRTPQLRFYADLPRLGQPGVTDSWQDEQQYDRKAVAQSCLALLAALIERCQNRVPPIELAASDQVRELIKQEGFDKAS